MCAYKLCLSQPTWGTLCHTTDFLTLNSWRNGRNEEGWLIPEAKRALRLGTSKPDGDPPKHVKIVPRLYLDLKVLVNMTSFESPPNIKIRSSHDKALYTVGDTSGSGFGSLQWIQDGVAVDAQFGRWIFDVSENNSSNFRESANLVNSLKSHLKNGKIAPGMEVFICTDNAVTNQPISKDHKSHLICTKWLLIFDVWKWKVKSSSISSGFLEKGWYLRERTVCWEVISCQV